MKKIFTILCLLSFTTNVFAYCTQFGNDANSQNMYQQCLQQEQQQQFQKQQRVREQELQTLQQIQQQQQQYIRQQQMRSVY